MRAGGRDAEGTVLLNRKDRGIKEEKEEHTGTEARSCTEAQRHGPAQRHRGTEAQKKHCRTVAQKYSYPWLTESAKSEIPRGGFDCIFVGMTVHSNMA